MAKKTLLQQPNIAPKRVMDFREDVPKEKMIMDYKLPADSSLENLADFVGLYITPKSITLPSGSSDAEKKGVEKKWIAVYSMKSGFGAQEKPTVEILRECDNSLAAPCDPSLPEGGPSIAGYLMGNAALKNAVLTEDQIAETKTFEIGTTVVGYRDPDTDKEPIAEVALQINPGSIPGRYTVRVQDTNQKSYVGAFEVATPTAAIEPQSAAVGAIKSGLKTPP